MFVSSCQGTSCLFRYMATVQQSCEFHLVQVSSNEINIAMDLNARVDGSASRALPQFIFKQEGCFPMGHFCKWNVPVQINSPHRLALLLTLPFQEPLHPANAQCPSSICTVLDLIIFPHPTFDIRMLIMSELI